MYSEYNLTSWIDDQKKIKAGGDEEKLQSWKVRSHRKPNTSIAIIQSNTEWMNVSANITTGQSNEKRERERKGSRRSYAMNFLKWQNHGLSESDSVLFVLNRFHCLWFFGLLNFQTCFKWKYCLLLFHKWFINGASFDSRCLYLSELWFNSLCKYRLVASLCLMFAFKKAFSRFQTNEVWG